MPKRAWRIVHWSCWLTIGSAVLGLALMWTGLAADSVRLMFVGLALAMPLVIGAVLALSFVFVWSVTRDLPALLSFAQTALGFRRIGHDNPAEPFYGHDSQERRA